jgi:hypothetical protein
MQKIALAWLINNNKLWLIMNNNDIDDNDSSTDNKMYGRHF